MKHSFKSRNLNAFSSTVCWPAECFISKAPLLFVRHRLALEILAYAVHMKKKSGFFHGKDLVRLIDFACHDPGDFTIPLAIVRVRRPQHDLVAGMQLLVVRKIECDAKQLVELKAFQLFLHALEHREYHLALLCLHDFGCLFLLLS